MRLTTSGRRGLALGVGAVLLFGVLALSSGGVARVVLRRAAERRGVAIEVDRVWPTWSGLRLVGSRVRVLGIPSLEVEVEEARVDLGPTLGVRRLSTRGARVVIRGSLHDVSDQLTDWRIKQRDRGEGPQTSHAQPELEVADASVLWWDDESSSTPRAEAHGLAGTRTGDGVTISASSMAATVGGATFGLGGISAQVNPDGVLVQGRATSLAVEWTSHGRAPPSAPTANGAESPHVPDVSTPLVEVPDLRAIHGAALKVAALVSPRLGPGAAIDVDAVTWKLALKDGSAVTIGPGALSVTHDPSRLQADFAAGATDGGPALTARIVLPAAAGDSTMDLQGGPVSLAVLGAQDGNTGLFDVAHTTVSGRAHLVLDADVRGLTFDCTGAARGVSVRDPMLAADDIHGLDVQVRARGAVSIPGDLRFDDLAATVGALRVEASGALSQDADHVAAAFRVSVPTTPCNTVLSSIPTALLPVVSGMAFSGTFGAEGRVAFDSRSLDDLELAYEVRDLCRATAVPASLARDAFARPFAHRVYLPDGSTQDEETGPGTAGWTPFDQISPFMEAAAATMEDGAFRVHHGFNRSAIRASIIANLKARRFVRGASTITMQLAKNLFLTREKTLSRKLEEVILTDYLEQIFSKDEILELYFNVVEFGPAVYGIGAAAEYYFGRVPADLDLAESFFLASILPSPLRYAPARDLAALPEGRLAILRALMHVARKRGLLSDDELAEGLREPVEFWHGGERPPPHKGIPSRLPSDPSGPGRDLDPDPGETDPAQ
jgi:hypothetical protein